MRRLFLWLCLCAVLTAPALTASCATSASNSFEVVRDGEKQSYHSTTIVLREEGPEVVLRGENYSNYPDIADDEYGDVLWVAFDAQGLGELATDQDYPISGEGSWVEPGWEITPNDVTFTGDGLHTVAVLNVFFHRSCYWCSGDHDAGAQSIQGTLRLTVNEATRLAGIIEVRVEGDVPGTYDSHQLYELTLTFDQSYADAGTP